MKKIYLILLSFSFFALQAGVTVTSVINPSCSGSCDGVIIFQVSGGVTPYTIQFSNGSGCTSPTTFTSSATSYTVSNVCGCGSAYTIVVTDASSAFVGSANANVNPPTAIQTFINSRDSLLCNGGKDTIYETIIGGTQPYSVIWTPSLGINNSSSISTGIDSAISSPISTTNYTITITDAHNCIQTNALTVYVNNCTAIEQFISNKENINIYPNPNNGSFVIETNTTTKQTMQVYDVNGRMVLSQTLTGKTNIDASSLNEGVYNINIISNEGVVNKRLVIVR